MSNRSYTTTILMLSIVALTAFALADTATASTQSSMLNSSSADRRAIARLVFGGFGWTVMGFASMITCIEFFKTRDAGIFMYLSMGILIFFFLGGYFNR